MPYARQLTIQAPPRARFRRHRHGRWAAQLVDHHRDRIRRSWRWTAVRVRRAGL